MSSNRVSILYLTVDNADADVVGSLVGIVREVQGGRGLTTVVEHSVTEAVASAEPDPAAALPAPKAKKRRAPKRPAAPGESKRAGNAGGTILAALRKSSRPDLAKLALAIYGDAEKTTKVKQVLGYMAGTGKIKSNGDGSYAVNG